MILSTVKPPLDEHLKITVVAWSYSQNRCSIGAKIGTILALINILLSLPSPSQGRVLPRSKIVKLVWFEGESQ